MSESVNNIKSITVINRYLENTEISMLVDSLKYYVIAGILENLSAKKGICAEIKLCYNIRLEYKKKKKTKLL